jgi:hypothetical protein
MAGEDHKSEGESSSIDYYILHPDVLSEGWGHVLQDIILVNWTVLTKSNPCYEARFSRWVQCVQSARFTSHLLLECRANEARLIRELLLHLTRAS